MVDAALDPVAVLSDLVRIDSVNPDLVPGAAGERAIVDHCAAWLREHVAPLIADERFEITDVGSPERPSLVLRVRGTEEGGGLLLNAHLDTVGVESYRGDAFSGRVDQGRVLGRGSFDTKSGAAAALVAMARTLSHGALARDLVLTLVADEEFGSTGTSATLAHLAERGVVPATGIVLEPSALELTIAHRGFAWFEVEVFGLAAHGSMPEQGVDALRVARALLRELDDLEEQLAAAPQHPLLGTGAVRVATMTGGSEAATVADRCQLVIERRTVPNESIDDAETDLRQRLARALQVQPGSRGELRRQVGREAFEVSESSVVVPALARALATATGTETRYRGEPFWTDARLVHEAGIDCVVVGVDGGGAHADEEWAEVASLESLTAALEQSIRELCALRG